MKPTTILIVEDEIVVAADLANMLRALGYEVIGETDRGEEAVAMAKSLLPDLVLMDISLAGEIDGVTAAEIIRREQDLPIVFLTAHSDRVTLTRAKRSDPFGYIIKPFDKPELETQIEMALYKHQAERKLRASEEKYRTVADYTYDWEFWIGPDGNFLYCSPSCQRITGHPAADFAKDSSLLRALVHPDDLAAYDRHRQQAEDLKIAQEFEFRITCANDSTQWRWIAHACRPIYDDCGQFLGIRGNNRDITEQKHLQAEVMKTRNIASLGILAGGIAHDFNNLFQGLIGNLSLAKLYVDESSKAFQILENAEQMYDTAAKLTGKLVTFSSGGGASLANISPEPYIKAEAASTLNGSGLEAQFDLADNLWPIKVDPSQFREVIKQLVLNAIDAMASSPGGKLKIITANENLSVSSGKPLNLAPGKYVRISIQDCGSGINKEDLPHIFDPYFSTKKRGSQKGMGLGLSLCYSVIHKSGGAITVESEPDKGSTFHLYIPADVTDPLKSSTLVKDQESKGPRILIMDDDPGVVEVMTRFLRLSGYRVDSARDGETAVAAYQEALSTGNPHMLVILDLLIPGGMGGKDVIATLKKMDPEVKAIAISGFAEDEVMTSYEEHGFVAACAKPFRLSEIKEIVDRFA